ncbi:hypothetical protein DH2020_021367 [Rehmannia glutinosa]|uniref:Reverse transcriptase domain-containing protein n=1 Tax=Rehmannia glutinosa TaxID=99300 RepID=A0ABR0WAV2_REHGL
MSILCWNCRGLGNPRTIHELRDFIRSKAPQLVFLSETKCKAPIVDKIKNSLDLFGFAIDARGRSGGLALLWHKDTSVSLRSYSDRYIDVDVEILGRSFRFTGVYGEPNVSLRRHNWAHLRNLADSPDKPWLMGGDFNEVLTQDEFQSSNLRADWQMALFRDTLSHLGMFDLGFEGPKFTWNRIAISPSTQRARLDRAVCNTAWHDVFPWSRVNHYPSFFSDHAAIHIQIRNKDPSTQRPRKKRPFRFEALWVRTSDCEEVIKNSWDSDVHSLLDNIKNCSIGLMNWGHHYKDSLEESISGIKKKLTFLRAGHICNAAKTEITELQNKLELYLDLLDLKWKQRAKFHWTSQKKIEQIILDHFGSIFTSSSPSDDDISKALGRLTPRISSAQNQTLLEPYTEREIVKALKHMHPFKSPGPDGMSPVFFQKFWHLIGTDVVNFILNFLNNGVFNRDINFTHIVLIPKTKSPELITHFRPISLCNVVYKIASKVLANRIKIVLPDIISESQSAFVPGRLITDNVLIAHEIHHFMRTKSPSSTGLMSIKLDMSKAFDRVEWVFIRKTMRALGFHPDFITRIMSCVSTSSFSFLLNGSEFGHLTPERGIRQGDPLSPYLFIICSEVFSCILQDLQICQKIHGISISRAAPRISHLFFADDTLLFGRATVDEARHLRFAIKLFERVSGQSVNLEKSGILFTRDVDQHTRDTILGLLGFQLVESHGKYLGLPSIIGRNKKEIFGFIKDKIWQRIHGWSKCHFSKAGKEILIKSVLQAIPIYAMSCFKFPNSVLLDIQSMISSFWWGSSPSQRKLHWCSWNSLARSKSVGGLGFRSFQAFNLALLSKQAWRVLSNPHSLLARGYEDLGGPLDSEAPFLLTSSPPTGFSFDSKVVELIDPLTNWWNYQLIRDTFNTSEAKAILSIPLNASSHRDTWCWFPNKNRKFSVRSAYKVVLDNPSDFPVSGPSTASGATPLPIWKILWRTHLPNRILHFSWRLLTYTLSCPENLERRHLSHTERCPLCNQPVIDTSHIFFLCPVVSQVWYLAGLTDLISLFQQHCGVLWAREIVLNSPEHVITFFLTLCCSIWYGWNLKCFEDQTFSPQSIVISAKQTLLTFQSTKVWPERPSKSLNSANLVEAPPPGIHIFFDGAISTQNQQAGLGIFILGENGTFIKGVSKSFPGITNPAIAEALALREAICLALTLPHLKVAFLGDSAIIISAAKGTSESPPDCDPILADITKLLRTFQHEGLFWIPRINNIVAHELAYYAKLNPCTAMSWSQPPDFLSQLALDHFQHN